MAGSLSWGVHCNDWPTNQFESISEPMETWQGREQFVVAWDKDIITLITPLHCWLGQSEFDEIFILNIFNLWLLEH